MHNLLSIKLVTDFPSAAHIFPPRSSPFVPSFQTVPSLVLLAGIGEIQTAFEPADPQAIIAVRPRVRLFVPGSEDWSRVRKGAGPPGLTPMRQDPEFKDRSWKNGPPAV